MSEIKLLTLKDGLKNQIKDEILTAAIAYGRTGHIEYLNQIRALTAILDNRRSAKCAISAHAITRYMQRSGSKNRAKAESVLKKMIDTAEEMGLKDRWKALQIINHNFKDATYLKYQSWLLVIVNNALVTCHFAEAKRWQKLDSREPANV